MRALARSLLASTRAFADHAGGNFATMTAFLLPAGLALAAIAIDSGSLFTERREVQSLADLSAIAAAANLANAELAVKATLTDNGFDDIVIVDPSAPMPFPKADQAVATVVRGQYRTSGAPGERFKPGHTPYNAVAVNLHTQGTRLLAQRFMDAPLIAAQGVSKVSATASFSIGSRLAALNGGIANALLGALLGGNVSLSLMDYEALVKADVGMFDFLDALATNARITAGTYDDLLGTQVTVGDVARAMASVPGLDHRSEVALKALGQSANARLKLKLDRMLDLGDAGYLSLGGRPAAVSAAASVMQILTAAAALANGTNQIKVDLGATVPGLLAATLDLAIGEPPQGGSWFMIGESGSLVRTAQTRLLVTVDIAGIAGLLGASIKVPIYIELAYAEAKLTDVACVAASPPTLKAVVAARPGVAELRIGDVTRAAFADFATKPPTLQATLVKLPLATIAGDAKVTVSDVNPTKLTFTKTDIDKRTIKQVSTGDFTQSMTKSLADHLNLTVKVVGIDLGLSALLRTAVGATLTAAAPAIDTLLGGILETLGVGLGQADVRVTGANCGRSVLVQ